MRRVEILTDMSERGVNSDRHMNEEVGDSDSDKGPCQKFQSILKT